MHREQKQAELEYIAEHGAGAEIPRTVVVLEPDLFFSTRLEDVIRAAGGTPLLIEHADHFVDAVDRTFPALAIVDLKSPGDWARAIQRCKMRPHTSQVPIYAFGSHVDVETLKRARQAGADHAWARSKMMEDLVALVTRHVNPPVDYPQGWDEPVSKLAAAGLTLLNQRDYFEQHELLELAWNEESRPIRDLYQGILQVGVAFLQTERGNWPGALKMFRRGLPRLRSLPPVCRGIDLAPFRAVAEQIHYEISQAGPAQLAGFDQSRFPAIQFENPYTPDEIAAIIADVEEHG
jgi:CheY-like chemotaxis protein